MQVIGGQEVHTAVIRLIEEAEKSVILISPYIEPWKRLVRAVEEATERGVHVLVVVRGGKDFEKQSKNLGAFSNSKNLGAFALERLHAKLYLSEKNSILTSMNLLGTSALDSHEAAVIFDRERDGEGDKGVRELARDILDRAQRDTRRTLKKRRETTAQSREEKTSALRAALLGLTGSAAGKNESAPKRKPRANRKPSASRSKTAKSGHCIRCLSALPLNLKKPLCPSCYATWAKFKDPTYPEKHCHSCGKEQASSVAKPVCRSCYRKLGA